MTSGRTRTSGVTLAVIAGGAGSRMGVPKHKLRIEDKPILEWLLRKWCWDGPTMLVVSADRPRVDGEELLDAVVADSTAGEGPLLGILTALAGSTTDQLIAAPIDMPNLGFEQFAWLADRSRDPGAGQMVFVKSATAGLEPFPALYSVEALAIIRELFDRGERSLRRLAAVPQSRVLDAPNHWSDGVWLNLNTPEDLARIQAAVDRPPTPPYPHEARDRS